MGEVETDNGSIGLSIDTRNIARKGYKPSTIDIVVNATTGNFSKTGLSLDEYTNMVKHSLAVDDLTEAQEAELREGVDLVITVKDENNNIIETKTISKTSFKSSPQEIKLEGEALPDQTPPVAIRSGVPHYIQVYWANSNDIRGGVSNVWWKDDSALSNPAVITQKESLENGSIYDREGNTLYYFEPIDNKPGVYAIAKYNGADKHYIYHRTRGLGIQTVANLRKNRVNTNPNEYLGYQWKIERKGVNNYTFTSILTGHPLASKAIGHEYTGIDVDPITEGTDEYVLSFRILSFDIDWDIEPLDTRYDQPILPESNTAAAFNSTLKNCSTGELVQTVGQSETKESIRTLTWEESIAISNEHSVGVSVTVGLEVETKLFGNGATASGSITGNYQYTRNKTSTTTNGTSFTESESITVSTERTITVPPKKATQVTDLYQTYSNVRIPFVQRYRIKGNFMENGEKLTGEEIMSQFHFNGFNGVITDIQSDFIEATVKGATTIDQLIDTKTSAEDVPTNCG